MATDWDWARTVNAKDPMPLHAQLERSIRVAIASRRLRPGDQLPTVRELAVALRINANTVARVYTHLERVRRARNPPRRRHLRRRRARNPTHNQSARDAELRAIATRALADASAHGFSAADLRRELQAISKGASS